PDTGARTVIDHVDLGLECCQSTVDPMAVMRDVPEVKVPPETPDGPTEIYGTLWLGPYNDLHPATPDLIVSRFLISAQLGPLVIASRAASPRAFGIFRLGWDGSLAETLVEPELTKYEGLPGQPAPTGFHSSSLAPYDIDRGCFQPPAGPDGALP